MLETYLSASNKNKTEKYIILPKRAGGASYQNHHAIACLLFVQGTGKGNLRRMRKNILTATAKRGLTGDFALCMHTHFDDDETDENRVTIIDSKLLCESLFTPKYVCAQPHMGLLKSSNYDQMSRSDVNEKNAQFVAEYENLDEASQEIWKF